MPFPRELYGPELLRAAKRAIEAACADVRETGGDDGHITRLMMSIRLMTAVADGEREPARLKLVALNAVDFVVPRNNP